MDLTLQNLIEAYEASFLNRNIVFGKIKIHERGFKYQLLSFIYAIIMVVKILLSYFLKKKQVSYPIVYFSWSPHHSRLAQRIGFENALTFYDYKSMDLSTLIKFKGISIFQTLKDAIKLNRWRKRSTNSYDNFFYCWGFVIEFTMLNNLLKLSKHVLMAGQLDRYAIMISIICRNNKIYLSFVQHGLNHIYHGLYKLRADEIYYLFEISIPSFGTYIENAFSKKFIPIPILKPEFKIDNRFKNAIGYASQTLVSDLVILDLLVKYHMGDILVYPHPTESDLSYFNKYSSISRVHITRTKIKNIKYLFSSGSTLGVEYSLLNVQPVFININNLESEIFQTDHFINFKDIDSFELWLKEGGLNRQ